MRLGGTWLDILALRSVVRDPDGAVLRYEWFALGFNRI